MARVIGVSSIVLILPMQVPNLPDRGGAVTARMVTNSVGGGFNILRAAAAQDTEVLTLTPLGTGPNSSLVRQALQGAQIRHCGANVVGDTGMKLVLLESNGQTTSIVSPGVEAELEAVDLHRTDVQAGDIIFLSAGDLIYPSYRQALSEWLPTLPAGARVALAASPFIDQVPTEAFRAILPYCQIVTMNKREAAILARRFQVPSRGLANTISAEFPPDCVIVRRNGAKGCSVKIGVAGEVINIDSYPAPMGDTIGVGETHVGVFIGQVARGTDPITAARRANAGAGWAIASAGVPPCPPVATLDDIAAGRVTIAELLGH